MKRISLPLLASMMVSLFVACSGGNSTPTSPTSPPTPTPTVTSVAVTSSPTSSTTYQMTAAARFSDSTTRDVTSSSAWTTSSAAVATVSSAGLVTVVGSGQVEIRATYQSVAGSATLQVTAPAVRFALTGVASEVAPNVRLLSGVNVLVTSGPGTGTTVATDAGGFFRFANLSGVVSLQATKDGYQLWKVENLTVDRDRTVDITLYPNPPTNASGATATARCNDGTWSWEATRVAACAASGGIAYAVCPGPICEEPR